MLKFSNDDYCTPRERAQYARSGGYRESTVRNTFGCDGTRNDQRNTLSCDGTRNEPVYSGGCRGVAIPKTCGQNVTLASVYAPYQEYTDLFDSATALCNGTLFRALFKPLGV